MTFEQLTKIDHKEDPSAIIANGRVVLLEVALTNKQTVAKKLGISATEFSVLFKVIKHAE